MQRPFRCRKLIQMLIRPQLLTLTSTATGPGRGTNILPGHILLQHGFRQKHSIKFMALQSCWIGNCMLRWLIRHNLLFGDAICEARSLKVQKYVVLRAVLFDVSREWTILIALPAIKYDGYWRRVQSDYHAETSKFSFGWPLITFQEEVDYHATYFRKVGRNNCTIRELSTSKSSKSLAC